MAQTIAVLSQKGGTGKTTAVRTLTDTLRRRGVRTLAIDLDPQGNLSDYFGHAAHVEPTIADDTPRESGPKSVMNGVVGQVKNGPRSARGVSLWNSAPAARSSRPRSRAPVRRVTAGFAPDSDASQS